MKYPMPDGSIAEMTVEEYAQLVEMGLIERPKPVVVKTQAQMLREAFEKGTATATIELPDEVDESTVIATGPVEVIEPTVTNGAVIEIEKPAPPVAYVTQIQMLIVEVLKMYPEGLKTTQVAAKLRWSKTKASQRVTELERQLLNDEYAIIERDPHHYVYRLTEYGRTATYEVVVQPQRIRNKGLRDVK